MRMCSDLQQAAALQWVSGKLGKGDVRIEVGPQRTTELRAEHRTDNARRDTKQRNSKNWHLQ
jgi:hypothetical protein